MSKKDKITIARTDDFAEVDAELTNAMECLDSANARIETLLREQLNTADNGAAASADGTPAAPQTAANDAEAAADAGAPAEAQS